MNEMKLRVKDGFKADIGKCIDRIDPEVIKRDSIVCLSTCL